MTKILYRSLIAHDSSNVNLLTFRVEDGISTLRVWFKVPSGKETTTYYEYSNVTLELWNRIITAESVGSEFSSLIRNNPESYPVVKKVEF